MVKISVNQGQNIGQANQVVTRPVKGQLGNPGFHCLLAVFH